VLLNLALHLVLLNLALHVVLLNLALHLVLLNLVLQLVVLGQLSIGCILSCYGLLHHSGHSGLSLHVL
jgi:hypothetical protein